MQIDYIHTVYIYSSASSWNSQSNKRSRVLCPTQPEGRLRHNERGVSATHDSCVGSGLGQRFQYCWIVDYLVHLTSLRRCSCSSWYTRGVRNGVVVLADIYRRCSRKLGERFDAHQYHVHRRRDGNAQHFDRRGRYDAGNVGEGTQHMHCREVVKSTDGEVQTKWAIPRHDASFQQSNQLPPQNIHGSAPTGHDAATHMRSFESLTANVVDIF